jgi:hypothetical protein
MTEWTLSIEESKALSSKNIFVLERDGRKLYVKTILSKDKTMLELIPLSKEELLALGVTVEESYSNTNLFGIDVEESASEEPKKKIYNVNDPDDMKEAEILAKQQLEKLKKTDPEHFDIEKQEDLEAENEDLKAKLAIVAEHALEKKMQELGVPEHLRATFREDPSKLQGYELAKQGTPQTPSGSMPLSKEQITGSSGKEEFSDVPSMVQDLLKRERNGDKSASKILQILFQKTTKGLRQKQVEFEADENSQPSLKELTKKKERE